MKILQKQQLVKSPQTAITEIVVDAPDIAKKALAGEFIVLMVNEKGERVPLTIVEADPQKGTITLVFQEIGFSTKLLGTLNVGDSIFAITGPLGHATQIKKYGNIVLVGGGVGIAEIYPVAKALKKAGNHITTILGSRNKELLILEKELESVSDELYVTTDDGSYKRKGFVTEVLSELIDRGKYDIIYAVGPIPMMNRVCSMTKQPGIKTIVSLNSLMIDGTGMCGGCRVSIADKAQFTCIDGPEFDGHLVNWDELVKRSRTYADKEQHICRLSKL